jgi:hypothetical protein
MLYKDNMKITFNQRSTTVNYSDKEMTFKPSHVINEQDERNLESRAKVSLLASQQRILNLMFMVSCIVNIFQYISNKMIIYTVYLYLKTDVNISAGTSTHHQERIQLYLQHLVFSTPLLLSAAIVEELEPV